MTIDIEHVDPAEAWHGLSSDADSILVDVRTRAEWSFVGVPDLTALNRQPILLEWQEFPTMMKNENFAAQLLEKLDGAAPSKIYFLCRTGGRSLAAAVLMSQMFQAQNQPTKCINIAEGFEGDLDSSGHRGAVNGWKVRDLAWQQS